MLFKCPNTQERERIGVEDVKTKGVPRCHSKAAKTIRACRLPRLRRTPTHGNGGGGPEPDIDTSLDRASSY